jgi:hypothetical protein
LYAVYNNATPLLLVLKQVLAKVRIDIEDLDMKPTSNKSHILKTEYMDFPIVDDIHTNINQ